MAFYIDVSTMRCDVGVQLLGVLHSEIFFVRNSIQSRAHMIAFGMRVVRRHLFDGMQVNLITF